MEIAPPASESAMRVFATWTLPALLNCQTFSDSSQKKTASVPAEGLDTVIPKSCASSSAVSSELNVIAPKLGVSIWIAPDEVFTLPEAVTVDSVLTSPDVATVKLGSVVIVPPTVT